MLEKVLNLINPASAAGTLGAVCGALGLILQLWLRAEWPTGRANEGSPKTMDPKALAKAAILAIAAGVIAANAISGPDFETPINAADGLAGKEVWYALAFIAFGYFAADTLQSFRKVVDWVKKKLQEWGVGKKAAGS